VHGGEKAILFPDQKKRGLGRPAPLIAVKSVSRKTKNKGQRIGRKRALSYEGQLSYTMMVLGKGGTLTDGSE